MLIQCSKRGVCISVLFSSIVVLCFWFSSSYDTKENTSDISLVTDKPSEKVTYMQASSSMIIVELPFPGAVTGKAFSVLGKARGTWYFEASFPIEVLDDKGVIIARSIAQAKSEWMTTDFVPFEAAVVIPETYIGKATLILKKDNPSGLSEHDASISFPIIIEY